MSRALNQKEVNFIEVFNQCISDRERIMLVLANKHTVKLMLDNDQTIVMFKDLDFDELSDECQEMINSMSFNSWLGWSDLIFDLLKEIGVEAESV